MRIVSRPDQLHVHAHRVAAFLHVPFEDVGDAKLPADFRQVSWRTFVELRGSARDHFEIGNLGQARQDFVLDAVGEVGVILICAQIFERQHGDAFFRNCRRLACSFCWV